MKKARILTFFYICFTLLLPPFLFALDFNELAYQTRINLKAGTVLNNEDKGGWKGIGDCLIFPYYDVRVVDGNNQKTEIQIKNTSEYGIVAKLRFREWSRGREVFSRDIWIPSNGLWVGEVGISGDGKNTVITSLDNVVGSYDVNSFYLSNSLSSSSYFSTRYIRKNYGESTLYGYIEVIGEEKTSPENMNGKVGRLAKIERDCPNTLMGKAFIDRVEGGVSMTYDAVAIGNFSRGQGSLFRSPSSPYPQLNNCEDTLDQLEFQLSKWEIFESYAINPSNQGKASFIMTFPTKHFHYKLSRRINQVNNPFKASGENSGETLKTTISEQGQKLAESTVDLPFSVNVVGLYKNEDGSPMGIDNIFTSTFSFESGEAKFTSDNFAQRILIPDYEYFQERFIDFKGLPSVGLVLQEYQNSNQLNGNVTPVEFSAVWKTSSVESVFIPTTPTGPTAGSSGENYTFTTGGSASSLGHPVEYQFDWGDGTTSPWGGTSQSKTWTAGGIYTVRARARCFLHTNFISNWSSGLTVTIESVSIPSFLSGPITGIPGTTYSYTTGGSISSAGHPVQYFFDWGDTTDSGWLPGGTTTATKSWTKGGSYIVKAKARCSTDTSVVSGWTSGLTVMIEFVSTPTTPVGPSEGSLGQSYSFSTGGAVSNLNHSLEYQFDWADGTFSSWGPPTQSKSWNAYGDFHIKARARCSTHPNVVSDWSSEMSFTIETVSVPDQPYGPLSGMKGAALTYTASGASSTVDHDLEYQFDWGDGSTSSWVTGTPLKGASQSKTWNVSGVYSVRARARCQEHPGIMSGWSSALLVTIEFVSTPNTPVGQASGKTGEAYLYTTGGSSSDNGHQVEYRFDWGDGTTSEWLPIGVTSVGKAWTSPGTYGVRAQARCGTHNTVISSFSQVFAVTIEPGPPPQTETVTTPSQPSGPTNVMRGAPNTYAAGGASSSLGHTLEYQFDWGDGTFSPWGGASQLKAWITSGTYTLKVKARCSIHPTVVSDWSSGLVVTVEFISTPNTPTGPTSGTAGEAYLYTTGGSSSDRGDPVQYRFEWGDGTTSEWLSLGTTSVGKVWTSPGTYTVKAQARCATHTAVVSDVSLMLSVTIVSGPPPQTETITIPFIEAYGPSDRGSIYSASNIISGRKNILYTFGIRSGVSNLGHATEDQFDWKGDGTDLTAWGNSDKSWAASGTYTIKVRSRCVQHPTVISDWSSGLFIVVDYISTPAKATWDDQPGDGLGHVGVTYNFSTPGGSTSEIGQEIQYRFHWGDATNSDSGWLSAGTTNASYTYTTQGTYTVRVDARGWWYLGADGSTEHFSYYSPELMVTIRP